MTIKKIFLLIALFLITILALVMPAKNTDLVAYQARACAEQTTNERAACFDTLSRSAVPNAKDSADIEQFCKAIGNVTDEGRFIDCVMSAAVEAYKRESTDLAYDSCALLEKYRGQTWICVALFIPEDMLRKEPDS